MAALLRFKSPVGRVLPSPPSPTPQNVTTVSNWTLIRRMLGLAWAYRWGCIKVLLLQICLLSFGLMGLGLFGLGVDTIRYHIDPTSKAPEYPLGLQPPADNPAFTVSAIAVSILVLALLRGWLTYVYTLASNYLVQAEIVVDLRAQVYSKLQRISFRFFDSNETGSIINRVTGDVQNVRLFVDGVILQTVVLILSLSVYLFYMLHIHVQLTIACLASTPFLGFLTWIYMGKVRPASLKTRELSDTLVRRLSENIQGIQVVKGFAREAEEIDKFAEANRHVREQQNWTFWLTSVFSPLISFIPQFNMVVLLCYGGYLLTRDPSFTLGQGIIVFAGLLRQFEAQVTNIATIANSAQQSLTGAQRVFEILDAPVDIKSKPDAVRLRRAEGALRFENVSFGYRAEEPVLQDIDFEVPAGSIIAITGATGAGKSTLLSLLPRFYDPDQGRVLLDGVDLRDMEVDDLRHSIGLVFQESFLFSNTVAANIAFGNPKATQEQIERAARIASAHDFIMELPEGYDTILGERGNGLSGGQRQRLAIARAILLDPPILLLDDPTAAIDPETEHEILEAMQSAMQNRTSFVVAHRLSTLRRADRVLVLEHGRIVESGTPDELARTSKLYRAAAKIQIPDEESMRLLGMDLEEVAA
ncbi:MAG: ATP-binding cassette, subfamily bacterial [Abditibacteriota bacterium]|nr:ATP-binding cassette, subfamily bacterial [Abditibacteriota bacterium]